MQTSIARLTSNAAPLADIRLRDTITAVAQSIAERFGVKIVNIRTSDSVIEVELEANRLAAIGFAAELRRVTNRWAELKKLPHFWPDPPPESPPNEFPFDGSYEGWLGPSE